MDSVNDFDELINSEDLTIIDFSATWCMPCRMLTPILEQVAEKVDYVSFYNLDMILAQSIHKKGV